jgi:hypothetical protein
LEIFAKAADVNGTISMVVNISTFLGSPKGGLTSEGILTLVPLITKGAKSLS